MTARYALRRRDERAKQDLRVDPRKPPSWCAMDARLARARDERAQVEADYRSSLRLGETLALLLGVLWLTSLVLAVFA